ncbi:Bacterial regulatory proteins, luxR family [Falsiruegeria litorea R37]|uniref:Bacterial regulatory proteins, luxR family n=1 Tax=Falsiruegeria litorea R37 TaxID=1200284 RepID=A0A1Y5TUD8_9RHOB|nr:helix-turn-helix transcriptional regulator [Falsiruegeria litorea]SLN71991.1 Bacterial regulatory proteins, luxR family [Falsiruegeria litorea R37]
MSPDMAPDKLGQLILSVGTEQFGETLQDWLDAVCVFDNIGILAFFQGRPPRVFYTHARTSRVFDRIDSQYVGGAYLLDPFFGLHQSKAPAGLYRLSDVAPDQFQRNEYFKSYYRNTTLTDELAFFCSPAPGVSITVCIGRDETTGSRFSTKDREGATRIAPVVNALVCRNWGDLRSEENTTPPDVAGDLRQRLEQDKGIALSGRQSEVALLVLKGHSSISIGLTLGISPQTVKVIRKQLYKKCQISSQGELYYLIAPYLSGQSD